MKYWYGKKEGHKKIIIDQDTLQCSYTLNYLTKVTTSKTWLHIKSLPIRGILFFR